MNVAIVVAAGKGTRFGSNQPKQFLGLGGVPIIIHTLRCFEQCEAINEIIVVLPAGDVAGFVSLSEQFALRKSGRAVAGGPSRARSVRAGLDAISDAELVAVHDGVRPLVTPDEIQRVVEAAKEHGAATLVSPVADTIKEVASGFVTRTPARETLRRALTPQCFRLDILKRAYEGLDRFEMDGIDVTDDSLLVEGLGVKVAAVEGSVRNIKITTAEDLAWAEILLQEQSTKNKAHF